MSDTPSFTEQQRLRAEAERLAAEAAADRKAAEEALAKAEYERGQAQHALREKQALEKNISARERWLKEHSEDVMLAREADAVAKLKQAQDLMASYDAAKHQAALELARDQREAVERGAAA